MCQMAKNGRISGASKNRPRKMPAERRSRPGPCLDIAELGFSGLCDITRETFTNYKEREGFFAVTRQ